MKSFSSRNSKARASLSMKRKSNIKIDYVTINDDESRFPNIGESWHTNWFLKVNKDPKRIGNNPRIYELHSLANTFDEMSLKVILLFNITGAKIDW